MPTEYPPSATDRATITVPNDGELASGGSLVGLRQLADLTAYLKAQIVAATNNVLAQAALKAAANAFTQPNTFTDITASGNVKALWLNAQDITADRDIDCGRNYTYLPPIARTTVVPYQAAVFVGPGFVTNVSGSITLPPNSRAEFPIHLPAGATLGFVRACVGTPATAEWYIRIDKLTPSFSSGGDFGTTTQVGTTGTGTVTFAAAPDVAEANGNGASIDPASAYWIHIGCPISSPADLVVSAVQLNWTDPGPRNH